MKLTLFTEELRECLNAAGLSDCGENDSWNYWYQRVLKAHNDAVERQIVTEQAENAKLRELIFDILVDEEREHNDDYTYNKHVRHAKELGIEVE